MITLGVIVFSVGIIAWLDAYQQLLEMHAQPARTSLPATNKHGSIGPAVLPYSPAFTRLCCSSFIAASCMVVLLVVIFTA